VIERPNDYLAEYAWDHRNRLTGVTFKNNQGVVTKSTAYEYDAFDRRVEATLDADGAGPAVPIVARWVYDGQNLLLVFNGAGELYHRYLFGPGVDQILADEQYSSPSQTPSAPGTVLWGLADNQGTIRDVIDATGAVLNHLTFTAFGAITAETNPSIEFAFAYTAHQRDESTALYVADYRVYDPSVGRWLSEDPIGFAAGDTNLARYVGNNATSLTDPSGLAEIPFLLPQDELADWVHRKWYDLAHISAREVNKKIKDKNVVAYDYTHGWGTIRTDFFAIEIQLPAGVDPEQILKKVRDDPSSVGNGQMTKEIVGWPAAGEGGRQPMEVVDLDTPGPENGAIVYFDVDTCDGDIAAMTVKDAKSGTHPVSGMRVWGILKLGNGNYLIYTMAIESASTFGGIKGDILLFPLPRTAMRRSKAEIRGVRTGSGLIVLRRPGA
jgi:RHS repeat-associated protein